MDSDEFESIRRAPRLLAESFRRAERRLDMLNRIDNVSHTNWLRREYREERGGEGVFSFYREFGLRGLC